MSAKQNPREPGTEAPAGAVEEGKPAAAEAAKPAAPESAARSEAVKEYFGELIKLKAEFENYRKRVDRERPELIQAGRAGVLDKLLPLYDVLLHAHEQVSKTAADGAAKDIVKGLELIFKEFSKVFEAEGVRPIETVGKPYDYDLHEVMGTVETDEWAEGVVAQEIQPGYTLKGKVLRPARVRISKAPAADKAAEENKKDI